MENDIKQKGIYKITNIINGKIYIGSASGKYGIYGRWNSHISELNKDKHRNRYLQYSWNKYGSDNFKFEVIEFVIDKKIILEREQYYLDLFSPYERYNGYNIAKIAGNSLGVKFSDETKAKMSLKRKGRPSNRKGAKLSNETKLKISIANIGDKNNMFGKSHTELTKSKIANKAIGRKCSDETKIKMSLKRKGKSQKDETKLKISLASPKRRGVFQLELNGVFIKKWDSITEASRALKIQISSISSVCRGVNEHCGGYKWVYLEPLLINKHKKTSKMVNQLDLNGNLIKKWDSVTEASSNLKIKKISDVCRGDRKTAGGFKWQYLENNNNNNNNNTN